jgi:Response regulator containing CheY-like receiver, AAA-type ATPase, and DNA-binding domains
MAVNAIKKGAYDFIEKPFNSDKLTITCKRAIESALLIKENTKLKSFINPKTPLIGKSNFIQEIKKNITKISQSNSRILISGMVGVGKKLIAQKIHQNSKFNKSLCTLIDLKNTEEKDLELFFSDSIKQISNNIIAQSNNTTLILENVDYLNINYQKKLLFLLENNNLFKNNNIHLNQKIISTTSKNLLEEVNKGNFIKILYDRLSTTCIDIPPINLRRDDIMHIFEYYIQLYNKNKKFKFSFTNNG